jgi:hypothetical protein
MPAFKRTYEILKSKTFYLEVDTVEAARSNFDALLDSHLDDTNKVEPEIVIRTGAVDYSWNPEVWPEFLECMECLPDQQFAVMSHADNWVRFSFLGESEYTLHFNGSDLSITGHFPDDQTIFRRRVASTDEGINIAIDHFLDGVVMPVQS